MDNWRPMTDLAAVSFDVADAAMERSHTTSYNQVYAQAARDEAIYFMLKAILFTLNDMREKQK